MRSETVAAITLVLALAACGSTPDSPAPEAPALPPPALDRAATLALACSGCHGSTGGAIASLDGRPADQIRQSLLRYRSDTAGTTVMHRMMRGYSEADINAISAYLAGEAGE